MSNSYFNFTTGRMVSGESALAEDVNSGFDAVAAGFDKLPTPDATKFLSGSHGTTSGSSGNFVLAVAADAYFDGMAISFKANHNNIGPATINVGSLGAKALVSMGGTSLTVGDILADHIYTARYNSTSDKFEIQGLSAGNIGDIQTVASNIVDISTIADNIDEILLADDSATAAAGSANLASGFADEASTYADSASVSAANLPNATTAGANKIAVTNSAGNGWEYPAITTAGKALLDDASATAQRATLELGSVNNTADVDKPVSTLTQAALDLKADLESPALTGNPTAPTQASADNSTKVATTAYVKSLFAGGTLPGGAGYGYRYINGTLVQAVTATSYTSTPTITFPVAFPNSVICVVFAAADLDPGDLRISTLASDLTKVGFVRTVSSAIRINIIAWGY